MSSSLKETKYYGHGLPYLDIQGIGGKLIVIEGTDGVGRSTQIEELKKWLEVKGYAVMTTGWTRSPLMGKAIEDAKSGHTLNVNTFSLLYAADFADRLEHEIIPALRAGFIVLADRYVYTAFARSVVRGADKQWIRKAFGFSLEPDAVFYMRIDIEDLIPRVINSETLHKHYWEERSGEGLDYWESGMDLHLGDDFYDSFVEYQKKVLDEFDRMTDEFKFQVVDATMGQKEVNRSLKKGILAVLKND
ncbi:MAG TPA: thymidylate kinase [Candidatus Kapabacteria bacterium]|nr:thymidylate kinase [Candidatus Kapabacteria bacterium]